MLKHFFRPARIWWPTWWGWSCFALLALGLGLVWFLGAESFFATTRRLPAEALVVEGWIGIEGIKAAKQEFETGGYQLIITTGGPFESRWGAQRWNYAEEAYEILLRAGVPKDRLLKTPASASDTQRTFGAALEMRRTLDAQGRHLRSMNVFTFGSHARRSRLVFAKAMGSDVEVGVVAWMPKAYDLSVPWWRSSERAEDVLKESLAYPYELLLNSGRLSNQSPTPAP